MAQVRDDEKPLTKRIEPGSPWENGYVESFNSKLRDELLARERLDTLHEAKVRIERWRVHYNTKRQHSSLGYRPPAPETVAIGPLERSAEPCFAPHGSAAGERVPTTLFLTGTHTGAGHTDDGTERSPHDDEVHLWSPIVKPPQTGE